MKRRNFMGLSGGAIAGAMLPQAASALNKNTMAADGKRKIVAYGAGHNPPFVKFVASLTGKETPRLCYLPTASADSPAGIIRWYGVCAELNVKPFVQNMFINSYEQKESFDEVLLSMDAIVVGGGNTLN